MTVASFVETTTSAGMSFGVTRVAPSGTPATVVAAGLPKPAAVAVSSESIALEKHAGHAKVSIEQVLDTSGLLPAIQSVIGAGCLLSFEARAMGVLAADAGGTASGATWLAALTAGQATVIGAGGSPGLIVLSSADYSAVIGELSASAGFATDARSAVGQFLGSLLHVSPKLATGSAYVLDPGAVIAVQGQDSPLVTVDPFSESINNNVILVSDLFAVLVVANPGLVVEVTKTV